MPLYIRVKKEFTPKEKKKQAKVDRFVHSFFTI